MHIRTLLGDVVDQESSYSTSVVGAGDRTISLLSSCVPDLRLDGLSINLHNDRSSEDETPSIAQLWHNT